MKNLLSVLFLIVSAFNSVPAFAGSGFQGCWSLPPSPFLATGQMLRIAKAPDFDFRQPAYDVEFGPVRERVALTKICKLPWVKTETGGAELMFQLFILSTERAISYADCMIGDFELQSGELRIELQQKATSAHTSYTIWGRLDRVECPAVAR